MTIDEAIELLSEYVYKDIPVPVTGFDNAIRLGVEAMQAWKEHRGTGSLMNPLLLPSETKE